MKKALTLLLALTLSLSLAACGGNGGSSAASTPAASGSASAAASGEAGVVSIEGKTVAFIPKLTGNAFFEAANNGAQEYAKDLSLIHI